MFLHPAIDPVALRLGPVSIRWYGIMYMVGFLCGWLLGRKRATPESGWTKGEVDDLVTWCIIGLMVGARLGYFAFYEFDRMLSEPLAIFRVWEGGMSFHGGLIGVAAACLVFARIHSKTFLNVADFIAPLAPVGLFAGRIGNFINGELWGKPTDLPWGIIFTDPRAGMLPRHPSQLYEAFLEGIVLFIIIWIFSAKKRAPGKVAGFFLLGYGAFRFFIEFFREPDPQLGYLLFNWVTMGQILCLPMIILGVWLLFRHRDSVSKFNSAAAVS